MKPWITLDTTTIPGQEDELTLRQRGDEFSIRTVETELMNSRVHGSEEDLAELALETLNKKSGLAVLIGGLGMGYTLAAALKAAPRDATITVAELIPSVVDWNKTYLGHLAGHPLTDSRVTIRIEDIAHTLSGSDQTWDTILLDVDNGPDGLTCKTNDRLYTKKGIARAWRALKKGGVLAVWSAAPDPAFTRRLEQNRFKTQIINVRARKTKKGSRHTIWISRK